MTEIMVAGREYGSKEKLGAGWDPQYQFGEIERKPWDRGTYEAACTTAAIVPQTDVEIVERGCALRYAEYDRPTWRQTMTRPQRVGHLLAACRLSGIDSERKPQAAAPVEMVKCNCGHSVPRVQVMNASTGTSCPDCYDRMSE